MDAPPLSISLCQHPATNHHLHIRWKNNNLKKASKNWEKSRQGFIHTHWLAVYTEASKQEEAAVWYCCEGMPRSTHWNGGRWGSGKQIYNWVKGKAASGKTFTGYLSRRTFLSTSTFQGPGSERRSPWFPIRKRESGLCGCHVIVLSCS